MAERWTKRAQSERTPENNPAEQADGRKFGQVPARNEQMPPAKQPNWMNGREMSRQAKVNKRKQTQARTHLNRTNKQLRENKSPAPRNVFLNLNKAEIVKC